MKKSDTGQANDQATLIASLMRASAYPHPVSGLQLLDTHISWVILTGKYAYKIKKALQLEFLDFSTLELRQHFCDEELRLNRRWAPELYLEVVSIGGSTAQPSVGGGGEPIEYAVKMRQFEQDCQLDKQLRDGRLSADDMRNLAETIYGYHEQAAVEEFCGEDEAIRAVSAPMFDNFPALVPIADAERLEQVRAWTGRSLQHLRGDLVGRRQAGFVRECHGDLHLTNLVRLPSGIVPYDCVEFARELRVMDLMSDISFLIMDLVARGRVDLGYTLINRYLEKCGDYAGLTVFGLYFVYHCMIRAKVAAIRNTERSLVELENRLAAALEWIGRPSPTLIVMHGFSASGKTWLSSRLLPQLPAIRLRSDIERKRMHGLDELERSESEVGEGIYTKSATASVYQGMIDTARGLLHAGFNVILDASFLRRRFRRQAGELAGQLGVGFVIIETSTSDEELERRLRARAGSQAQASEADRDVLAYQLSHCEPFDESETRHGISVATDRQVDLESLIRRIRML